LEKDNGTFALNVATKCLSYYNEFFGIPYPLPKLDMIALQDFAAGAMENWGLVTYRETALLMDEKLSGVATRQRVAHVVAHELAHQWFGNLVTMDWWKELWLNEGFATFIEHQAVDHLFPEWDIWVSFVGGYMNNAFQLDSLENSHPIEVEVYKSSEIEEIFDSISYNKGSTVLRMIADLIGADKFKKGLNIYLNRHKYQNAVTEDLWKALSEVSGFDVPKFMDNYTKLTGYPLLKLSSTDKPNLFAAEQSRFFSSGKDATPQDGTWWISLGIRTSESNAIQKYDFKNHKDTISLDVEGCRWWKANPGQSGFYRVGYSPDLLNRIKQAVTKLEIPATDRIGLESDVFALAKAGKIDAVEALSLVASYVNEFDYNVWADLSGNLGQVQTVWSNEPNFDKLKKFVRNLFDPVGKKLGWEKKPGESDLNTLLRTLVLNQLAINDHPEVVAEAKRRFGAYLNNNQEISPDLRVLVYKTAVANGGQQEYDDCLKIYRTAELQEEKLRALRALGYSTNPDLIHKTLEFGLSDEVRAQDLYIVIWSCAVSSKTGRELTWKFMQNSWKAIHNKIGNSGMLLDRIIAFATQDFASEEKAQEVREYFAKNPVPSAERSIKQSIESIMVNARWLTRNRQSVANWLDQHSN